MKAAALAAVIGLSLGAVFSTAYQRPVEMAPRVNWLQNLKALAEGGNVNAQFVLGLDYQAGACVERDLAQASAWFRKAAEQNDSGATFQLSRLSILSATLSP